MVIIVLFVLPMVFPVSLSSNPVCGSGTKLEEQPLKWERLGMGSSMAVRKRLLSVLFYVVGLFHVAVAQRDESFGTYGVGAWVTSAKGDLSGFVIVFGTGRALLAHPSIPSVHSLAPQKKHHEISERSSSGSQ